MIRAKLVFGHDVFDFSKVVDLEVAKVDNTLFIYSSKVLTMHCWVLELHVLVTLVKELLLFLMEECYLLFLLLSVVSDHANIFVSDKLHVVEDPIPFHSEDESAHDKELHVRWSEIEDGIKLAHLHVE